MKNEEIRTGGCSASPPTYVGNQHKIAAAMKFLLICVAVLGAVGVLGLLIWLGYTVEWTGFGQYTGPIVDKSQTFARAKTLWDWLQLLIIPVALALGVFGLNHEDAKQKLKADDRRAATDRDLAKKRADIDRELAREDARERELTSYFDTIAKLLLESGLRTSEPMSEVREVARAYTLAAVHRLDGYRKGMVLQFLSNAQLITKPNTETHEDPRNPTIRLDGADFSGVCWFGAPDLTEVNLTNTDLRAVNLRKANLTYADLSGAWLQQADLRGANCRFSTCYNTDFSEILRDGDTDFAGAEGYVPTSDRFTERPLSLNATGKGNRP